MLKHELQRFAMLMFHRWSSRFSVFFIAAGLAQPALIQGTASENGSADPSLAEALVFLEQRFPAYHRELKIILEANPQNAARAAREAKTIHLEYKSYQEMDAELADIFLTIKKRELKNQLYAEQIQQAGSPEETRRLFEELRSHMDRTFDLNLKLVAGELEWLEEQVKLVREEMQMEKANKRRFIKEDLAGLLLKNELLFDIFEARRNGQPPRKNQPQIRELIQKLPEDSSNQLQGRSTSQ